MYKAESMINDSNKIKLLVGLGVTATNQEEKWTQFSTNYLEFVVIHKGRTKVKYNEKQLNKEDVLSCCVWCFHWEYKKNKLHGNPSSVNHKLLN